MTPTVASPRTPSYPSGDSSSHGRFVPGTVIAGRYRIVGRLGTGGMGEVYRADDMKLGQTVALKFLPPSLGDHPSSLARLHNEVRVARQVAHPNVCRVYDIVEDAGLHFLSMEYVDGEDLAALLRRIGRLPRDKALEIARQLCAGLAAAHETGILHRDLKPANVMLDGRGKVRITDFGLAGLAEEVAADARSGTPAYMAPEQLDGKEITARSDLYSLGLVLYEVFTGNRGRDASGRTVHGLSSAETAPASPSRSDEPLDPVVERVLSRCLAEEPRDRPASAMAIAAALPGGDPLAEALAAGETPSPEMVAAAGQVGGLTQPVAWALLVSVLAGLLLAVLTTPFTRLTEIVGLPKSPVVLADRAREIVQRLGNEVEPTDAAYKFSKNEALLNYVSERDASGDRWRALSGRVPSAIAFWYRSSPRYLIPAAGALSHSEVTPTDPPVVLSGMISLELDPEGRLMAFRRVPPQLDDTSGPWPDPDWEALFAETAWDYSSLEPVEPKWNPLMDCDVRAAWETVYPGDPPKPLRIEAGAYRGQPVYLESFGPWDRPTRMEEYKAEGWEKAGQSFGIGFVIALLLGAALMARRNLRLGRGDRRGGLRIVWFFLATFMAIWLLRARHVPDVSAELGLFFSGVATALLEAAIFWMIYMALEPLARKIWPDVLISWSRVLAGRLRDPLVGRDILIGSAFGIGLALMDPLGEALNLWAGYPPSIPGGVIESLTGVGFAGAALVMALTGVFSLPMIVLVVMVLLRAVLRRPWLANGTAFLIFGALFTLSAPTFSPSSFLGLVVAGGLLVMIVRFGVVAVGSGVFVANLIGAFPITTDLSSWYAGYALFALAVVVAVALYGFRTSLAGRPMFGGGLIQD